MAVPTAESPLEYARPVTQRGRKLDTPLHAAFACGLVPALLGTCIIALWLVTRFFPLKLLGLLNILFGLTCAAAGAIALFLHFQRSLHSGHPPPRRWLLRGVLAGAILLGNFPLCGLCIWASGLYTVRVVNATGANVSSFVVTDPVAQKWELGPIRAGGRTTRLVHAEGEGAIWFSAKVQGGRTITGEVEGYISGSFEGTSRTVTLNADGSHSVR